MFAASISEALDVELSWLERIRVGRVPSGMGSPHRCVLASDDAGPVLRIDVYAYDPDCFAFEDAIIWRDYAVIGFGSDVHVVSISDRSVLTIALGSHFGHVYPTPEYLLIASGERLFRMDPDRRVRWKSDVLGIDGVVVDEPRPPVIRGEGEWDPPGGWKAFALLAADGSSAS